MEIPTLTDRHDVVAELKLQIIRQQERAAKFCKSGQHQKARAARGKLLVLLNQLDLLELIREPSVHTSKQAGSVVSTASVGGADENISADDLLFGPINGREGRLSQSE
jgi:hypothetical protein